MNVIESLEAATLVGAGAGWLAWLVMQGAGLGLLADMGIGILGAGVSLLLLTWAGVHVDAASAAACGAALAGAALSLGLSRVIRRQSGRVRI